ncbi:MAG TPA: phosphonate ABC transporter ATP-binding protein [Trebonia sp.]|jgi:phosphonate transport system ATP-binding protein|nr:phosphonate ABC transporter ATP-binding protein [Trebonia sp.]
MHPMTDEGGTPPGTAASAPVPGGPVVASGTAVRLHQVTKDFAETRALDAVDLTVPAGQMLAILGASGSGKSTLLRTLNGLVVPTSGTVEVLDTDVTKAHSRQMRQLRTGVGFIFQQFGLIGRLSVMENVLSGALGRIRFPRAGVLSYPRSLRVEALGHLDRVGLADRAFQRSDTLSGGQQQRAAIARTLMQRPTVLLADEPVASLDPESSAAVLALLMEICQEKGLTVITSLHQVELARGWADRLVGMRAGRVVLDSSPKDVSADEVMEIYRGVVR